jgi:putative ABC transport system permease protein
MLTDLKFALRMLAKHPGFTLFAVLAIGVGIGLSSAIFNAYSAIVLRPVPGIADEHRLVNVSSYVLERPNGNRGLSVPDALELAAQSKTLEGWTVLQARTMILGGGEKPERFLGTGISAGGFQMLGAQPLRGRLFRPDEETGAAVAILSHAVWQSRFGGRDDAIGQTVILNGSATTIVGVMPEGFRFPEQSDLWVPFGATAQNYPRSAGTFTGYARLKAGVSLDEAQAELASLGLNFARTYRENQGTSFRARAFREQISQGASGHVRLLLGAVIFVLLIACANVANLLLAKSAARAPEIAIRTSLGATRGRIVRQVLTESVVLGTLGGLAGLGIGLAANRLMLGAIPVELPFWMRFEFDWRVFGFAAGAAIGSAVLFGLFPALQVSRSTAGALKESARTGAGSRRSRFVRHGLVVSQVAMAMLLLVGAGLMIRSYLATQSVDYGFDTRGVLTFRVGLPQAQFRDREVVRRFFEQFEARLGQIPGVQGAGATSLVPGNGLSITPFHIEGRERAKNFDASPFAVYRYVSPGYFPALGIPLLRGRLFTEDDRPDTPRVALIDQACADKWFPGVDPIGRRISVSGPGRPDDWFTIVGIVGNVTQRLESESPRHSLYTSARQQDFNFVNYLVRTEGDPTTYVQKIQDAALAVQPDIPIYSVLTLERSLAQAYWDRRFFGQLFTTFGAAALFLAALGIYGVMAFTVTQRTPEIGVRMALGAQRRDVLVLIGRQGLTLVLLGIALGLVAALGLTRLLANFLFGVNPSDPATYLVLTAVLGTVGLVACWLPAARASRVDPIVALRAE